MQALEVSYALCVVLTQILRNVGYYPVSQRCYVLPVDKDGVPPCALLATTSDFPATPSEVRQPAALRIE